VSDWQSRLDLKDVWDKYPDEITVQELCKTVAERLRELDCPELEEIWDSRFPIADEFEILSTNKDATVAEFDEMMDELYSWGDTSFDYNDVNKKVCWIATNF